MKDGGLKRPVKAELLTLLTAKSMNYEISSTNHNAITSEDIAHFLGTKNLKDVEYDFLMAKYTDDNYSRSLVFHEIYQDFCTIFMKYVDVDVLKKDRHLIRNFVNLALREVIYPNCFMCQGRGTIANGNSIEKCQHCDGTGQFIYDDDNRPEFLGYKKEEYMKLKKPYLEILELVKNIEINALYKIGDDS